MRASLPSCLALGTLWCSLLLPNPAGADDAYVQNVGGTVKVMGEHPTIRLVAEHVRAHIHRRYADVECVFFLRNDGLADTVLIGFPDQSRPTTVERATHFEFFESFVNGRRVEVLRTAPEMGLVEEATIWWTKEVAFAAGETKVILDRYRGGTIVSSGGGGGFRYLLRTGSSWAGTIGSISAVFSLEDFGLEELSPLSLMGASFDGNEIRWVLHDFEPQAGSGLGELEVHWRPSAATCLESELHRAAGSGDIATVRRLLAGGADIDVVADWGTPLSCAIHFGAGPEMVDYLLQCGAKYDPDRDPLLRNAIDACSVSRCVPSPAGCAQVIRVLVAHGADLNACIERAGPCQTALTFAVVNDAPGEVIQALEELGGHR